MHRKAQSSSAKDCAKKTKPHGSAMLGKAKVGT